MRPLRHVLLGGTFLTSFELALTLAFPNGWTTKAGRSTARHASEGSADGSGSNSPKLLPDAASSVFAVGGSDDELKTLTVDGAPILLNKLGPVVVTKEGLMGSIDNWHELSENEQALVMKRIGRRNQERIAALKEEQARAGEAGNGRTDDGS